MISAAHRRRRVLTPVVQEHRIGAINRLMHSTPDDTVWRRKTDAELRAAELCLGEYTAEGQQAICAELEWRRSPEYLIAQEALQHPAEETRTALHSRPAQTQSTTWLVQRALLAIALMIGFYVFSLAIALGLLWVPYAEWVYVGRLDLKIAAVCIGAAFAVLWALVPRADAFEPPGPRLDDSTHPGLFQLIRQVAAATGQSEPADVYLLNEVNAWVTHRGGSMGFGSRRVMGIGLPLMQALSVPEFKAIVAHEFGHYSSGDVKLGPWIYKTRAAIGRTIAGVHGTFIEAPFLWYGHQFLRLTHAVSRQQEFIADQVAARIAGAPDLAGALRRVTAVAPVFSSYVRDEVMPVLQAGFLPPIAEGFDEFLRADRIADASQRIIDEAENDGRTDLFDTHPSLRDRLAALSSSGDVSGPASIGGPASSLIGDVDKYAQLLAEFALGRDEIRKLKPIDWNVVGESVFAVRWREVARTHANWLSQVTADSLPCDKRGWIQLGSGLVGSDEENVNSDDRIGRAVSLAAVGIGVALLDQGWRAQTRPGLPVLFVRGSETFDPSVAVRALAEGATTPDTWKELCDRLGVTGRPLGDRTAVTAAPPRIDPVVVSVPRVPEVVQTVAIDEVNCWRCKQALRVNAENRGKTVKCPRCGTKQQLPQ
jgi:heat shock protein HtpX